MQMPAEQPPKTQTADGSGDTGTGTVSGGGGTPSPAAIYYGYCDSPSHEGGWTGPDRDVLLDAQYDCRDHNAQCDTQGARVLSRTP